MKRQVVLNGTDGGNPLGFLAALGTLRVLTLFAPANPPAMRWTVSGRAWRPLIESDEDVDESLIVQRIHSACCRKPDTSVMEARQQTTVLERRYRDAKKALDKETKKKLAEMKGLRGEEAKVKKVEVEKSLAPFRTEVAVRRKGWLGSLRRSVVLPHLRLGQDLSVTPDEFRAFAVDCLEAASLGDRAWPDRTASFGCESVTREDDGGLIEATEFCFLFGSGHQHYLETMSKLAEQVEPEHLNRTLFLPWDYKDERLSMRWDPSDARKYALQWKEPEGDIPMTMWGANLLACEGAALYPAMPQGSRLATTGITGRGARASFRWPIWDVAATMDVIRSLLALRELHSQQIDRERLGRIGIVEIFQAVKIKVGDSKNYKWSFAAALSV